MTQRGWFQKLKQALSFFPPSLPEHISFETNSKPKVTFILWANKRHIRELKETLNSFVSYSKETTAAFEIIITDDTASQYYREVIKNWAIDLKEAYNLNVQYIFNKANIGQKACEQQAIAIARSDIVEFIEAGFLLGR